MESIKQVKNTKVDLISNNDPLNKNRALIENLWESVLREECPNDQADRLIQLKELSYSNQVDEDSSKTFKREIIDIVNSMDLAESIAAARALAKLGDLESALPVLEIELQSEHQWGRLAAVIVLDEMGDQARPAIPALKKALVNQPNKYIVRVANRALNELLGTNNTVR